MLVTNLDGVNVGYHHVFVVLDSHSENNKHAPDLVERTSENPVQITNMQRALHQKTCLAGEPVNMGICVAVWSRLLAGVAVESKCHS